MQGNPAVLPFLENCKCTFPFWSGTNPALASLHVEDCATPTRRGQIEPLYKEFQNKARFEWLRRRPHTKNIGWACKRSAAPGGGLKNALRENRQEWMDCKALEEGILVVLRLTATQKDAICGCFAATLVF